MTFRSRRFTTVQGFDPKRAQARIGRAATVMVVGRSRAHDRIGATVWAIRARLPWATLLAERGGSGDAERAAQLLTQARAGAETLGTPALLERGR